jgi:hypothetical protein
MLEFRDLLPLLNSGRIVLPRNDRLQGQIVGLERRTSAVGRDTISHPDRGHDDVANAVAGAAALSKFGGYDTSMRWVSGDDDDSGAAWSSTTSRSACSAANAWIAESTTPSASSAKSPHGKNNETAPAHASNGCSQPKKPAPKWAAPIPSRPKSHIHCAEVLVANRTRGPAKKRSRPLYPRLQPPATRSTRPMRTTSTKRPSISAPSH